MKKKVTYALESELLDKIEDYIQDRRKRAKHKVSRSHVVAFALRYLFSTEERLARWEKAKEDK